MHNLRFTLRFFFWEKVDVLDHESSVFYDFFLNSWPVLLFLVAAVQAPAPPPSQVEGQVSGGEGTLDGFPKGRDVLCSGPCCLFQTQCTDLQSLQLWVQNTWVVKDVLHDSKMWLQHDYSPVWVKRGALLTIWTCVAFTGRVRKVLYSETSTFLTIWSNYVSLSVVRRSSSTYL